MRPPARSIALWIPDWPIIAHRRESAAAARSLTGRFPAGGSAGLSAGLSADDPPADDTPVAILHAGAVVACSAAARAAGVRRGQRRRDAQSACPTLEIAPENPVRDAREFSPLVAALEELSPGVQIARPGLCFLPARGPARYYGGEEAAAELLRARLAELSGVPALAGVADGVFTAEQAARHAGGAGGVLAIPPGASGPFLAPLPTAALGDADFAGLLARLGIRTLGALAALAEGDVEARFGTPGRRFHRLAAGGDPRPVVPRTPPAELDRAVEFDPPLALADQVAFGVRRTADDVADALGAHALVCTGLRVEIVDARGERSERLWLHPTFFSPADMVDRVRWQLEAALARPAGPAEAADDEPDEITAGARAIVRIHLHPDDVDDAAHHAPGLFGRGTDERVHHALSRVQSMLGHEGVLTPAVGAGRSLPERQRLVAWGDRAPAEGTDRPWPGHLPPPLPTTVFADEVALVLRGADGEPVRVDDRGTLSGAPHALEWPTGAVRIIGWAGPWGLREREWDASRRRLAHRLQVIDERQGAWLLVLEGESCLVEGRYD